MTKNQFLRVTAFLLVVASIIVFMCDLFEYPNSHMSERFETFENFEKDTVDAVYIGTSGVDRFWIAAKAFDEYGMTVYPLSVDAMPSWAVLNILKEGTRKQNPKLVIIDMRPFCSDPSGMDISVPQKRSRRIIDQLGLFSLNRLSLIHRSLTLMNEIDPSVSKYDLTFYLPFIRYHGMWSDETFTFDEIGRTESKMLGLRMAKSNAMKTAPQTSPVFTDKVGEMDKYSSRYLSELVAYIKENGINALFVSSPKSIDEEEAEIFNAICKYLDDEGMKYLNFNTKENAEKYKMDFSKDYYDEGHVNYKGAIKYTDYFAKYLDDNYDLPDRREDPKCESWHGVYDYILGKIDKWESEKK